MFRPNETHHQEDLFGLKARLPRHTWKLLAKSQEYAFYEQIFCRIPESLFAELYDDSAATRPNVPVNRLVGALILSINFAPVPNKGALVLGLAAVALAACVAFLLRQRRARRHYGGDPGGASARAAATVEGYLG